MQLVLPFDYNFFPNTYTLPHSYKKLMEDNESGKRAHIVKPEAEAQGRGIYLTKDVRTFKQSDQCIV